MSDGEEHKFSAMVEQLSAAVKAQARKRKSKK